jgi:ABC-type nitrate/sulfonate/bicarbonate transport system permease component
VRRPAPAGAGPDWLRLAQALHLPTLLVLLVGLGTWSAMSDRFGPYLLPPPGRVLDGLAGLATSGQLWLHVGASLIVLPVLLSSVGAGVDGVDRQLLEMAQVYRLSALERFRHVTLPSAVRYLVAGMRVAFALGLRVSVVAELFGVSAGIGYAMNLSRDTLRTDLVFAWALVLIAVMVLTEKLVFEPLCRRANAWR